MLLIAMFLLAAEAGFMVLVSAEPGPALQLPPPPLPPPPPPPQQQAPAASVILSNVGPLPRDSTCYGSMMALLGTFGLPPRMVGLLHLG